MISVSCYVSAINGKPFHLIQIIKSNLLSKSSSTWIRMIFTNCFDIFWHAMQSKNFERRFFFFDKQEFQTISILIVNCDKKKATSTRFSSYFYFNQLRVHLLFYFFFFSLERRLSVWIFLYNIIYDALSKR